MPYHFHERKGIKKKKKKKNEEREENKHDIAIWKEEERRKEELMYHVNETKHGESEANRQNRLKRLFLHPFPKAEEKGKVTAAS